MSFSFAMKMFSLLWKGCAAFVLLSCASSACGQSFNVIPTNAFPSLVFSNPICIASPPGETNRLFVVEKRGRIIVITNLAAPTRTVFLDIANKVRVGNYSESADVQGEQGLLGLAFHPNYASNGTFFVFYTATNGSARDDILARYQTSIANANQGDPNSETRFIVQFDEANNHNGGDMHFGQDGYLYVALGDEGGSYGQYGNTQKIDRDFFSAIMRIDVDNRLGNLPPNPHAALPSLANYSIPADNPFIGTNSFNGLAVNPAQVRTEFWAVGMRNPWRFSFDPATGILYLGHVGQSVFEWINILSKGDNAGWNFFEGTRQWTNSLPPGFSHIPPLIEYGHTNGRAAIIGGVVYRGARVPQLSGAYIYADEGSSEIFMLRHSGMTVITNAVVFKDTGALPSGFGIDPSNGDVLYTALRSGNNSIIKRIVSIFRITSVALSGTNLIASGVGGSSNGNYTVVGTGDLTVSQTNWTSLMTNSFDALGNFIFTNPVTPDVPQMFLRVRAP
jgi:glucose/arabinose dehydrogenase